MEQLPLYCQGERRGEVVLSLWGPNGARTEIAAAMDDPGDGLYRAFLLGEGGELPLGVLAPEGQCLRVTRRFSPSEMGRAGAVRHGLRRLSYAFERGGEPWQAVTDGFFRRRFQGRLRSGEGALWQKEGDGRVLAIPWDCGRPFPLMELMCFVRLRQMKGRLYGCILFDKDEWPQMAAAGGQRSL